MVLDEPTNDLDLETLDLLQEIVADYAGTVIVVSHDRDFLDRTVTRTLAYEGQAKWQVYAGGYTDMVNQRGVGVQARKAEKAAKIKSKSNPTTTKSSPTKLSYKHKFRLESLPAEMEKIEAEIVILNAALADPKLYSVNPDLFNVKSSALVDAQLKLAACEEEWLELEMLREEAGG